jgi:hypothetical protein
MKLKLSFALLILVGSVHAQQTQHGVDLSCTGNSGSTFSIYRTTAAGAETKPPLAANLTTCAYSDNSIVIGTTYFYTMTQTVGGVESGPSLEVSAQIMPPNAPTNPKAAVH